MANMIDNDKMWASLIEGNSVRHKNDVYEYGDLAIRIRNALKEQGLEYKEGSIKPIESKPKFKIGQTIVYKDTENIAPTKMTISEIANGQYWDDNCCIVPISDQDNWELEKPSTIKFDEPDIEEMVEKYRKANECELLSLGYSLGYLETLCNAYRRGLKEMYKYLKKGE